MLVAGDLAAVEMGEPVEPRQIRREGSWRTKMGPILAYFVFLS